MSYKLTNRLCRTSLLNGYQVIPQVLEVIKKLKILYFYMRVLFQI